MNHLLYVVMLLSIPYIVCTLAMLARFILFVLSDEMVYIEPLVNYSATSYRASCFNHRCVWPHKENKRLTQCPQALCHFSSNDRFGQFLPYLIYCLLILNQAV